MPIRSVTPILNVSDVPKSLAWMEALGWKRSFAWNSGGMIHNAADSNQHGPADFAGLCSGEAQLFLCRDAQGSRGAPLSKDADPEQSGGVWMSWWCEKPTEVDALYKVAQKLGFETPHPPTHEPWGVYECWIRHPDGHTFRISAHLS
ncbi:MAG: VOC family protein [Planctomycetes bacterium]|nr:VOC family protein [Planctomycetota bacterium]